MSTDHDVIRPHIPKLIIRNRVPGNAQDASSQGRPSASLASSPHTSYSNTPPSSSAEPSHGHARSRSAATASTVFDQAPRKKRNSVLGFLSLKEPSSVALEEFAQQQKKAAAAKGPRATAVGLPGVSTQKLPDHVPKVNSKWDGLPEDGKQADQQKTSQSKRLSMISNTTRKSQNSISSVFSDGRKSPRLTVGSLTSRPQSLAVTHKRSYRGSVTSSSSSEASLRTERAMTSALQPAVLAERPTSTFLARDQPASPTASPPEVPLVSTLERAPGPTHTLHTSGLDYSDKIVLEPPLEPPNVVSLPQVVPSDGNRTLWYSDTDADDSVDVISSGHGVLAPPSVIYWTPTKVPLIGQILEEDESDEVEVSDWPLPAARIEMPAASTREARAQDTTSSGTPTLHSHVSESRSSTTSHATDTTLTTVTPSRISTTLSEAPTETSPPSSPGSIARPFPRADLAKVESNSDHSIAPSIMSAQWRQSPKQRLGLGSKLKRSEVLPWESEKIAAGPPPAIDRQPVSSANVGKRLSAMLSRKT